MGLTGKGPVAWAQPRCSAPEVLSVAEDWHSFLLSLEEMCFTAGMCFCLERIMSFVFALTRPHKSPRIMNVSCCIFIFLINQDFCVLLKILKQFTFPGS